MNELHAPLARAIAAATGLPLDELQKLLVRPKELALGDVSLPCFLLSKQWKIPPPACAERLRSEIALPSGFSEARSVGPYLNFFYDRAAAASRTLNPLLGGSLPGHAPANSKAALIVEYLSANIAKPVHVGHLRNVLIGCSLDRVHRFLGYSVVSIDHLGDWGTQFGIVYAGCTLWGKPATPGVDELVDLYIRAAQLKKAQEQKEVPKDDADKPDVTVLAREYFKRLEAGDKDALEFWEWCRSGSVAYLERVCTALGIKFDHHTGESFFRDKIGDVERRLRESGILSESRGSLGVDLEGKLGFVRIFAEDGRSLYITRDIATAIYRYDHFRPEKILYVVANQQEFYFRQLIEILRRMKHPVAEIMVHVKYGMVPGMKTREGGAISLAGYLQEAKDRALTAYKEGVTKRPEETNETEVAEAVAIGATYFYFLLNSNDKDFNFSWDEALNFQGDSGPYVQYAAARLRSMEAKAAEAGISSEGFDPAQIADERSYELVSLLNQFEEQVLRVTAEYEPCHLARYALEVAKAVARVYRELRVVGAPPEQASARLALFKATRYVLESTLHLVGVPTLERM